MAKLTPEHINANVVIDRGCWLWTVCKHPYKDSIHRKVYEAMVGPIPEGLRIHHTCNRGPEGCVNPDHLKPVTHGQNIRLAHRWHSGQMPRVDLMISRVLHDRMTEKMKRVYDSAS